MGIFDAITRKVEDRQQGIKMSDLLGLPRPHLKLMTKIVREKQTTLQDAVEYMALPEHEVRELLDLLIEKGYLQYDALKSLYRVHYGRTDPQKAGGLWAAIDQKTHEP